MGLMVTILQGTQLLGVLTNVGLDLALKIKGLFSSLGNDVTVNIHTTDATAVTANNDTLAVVNDFLLSKGLAPLDAVPTILPLVPALPVTTDPTAKG